MQDRSVLQEEIARLKARLSEEKTGITDIMELVPHGIEREAGIWEYDFDELEAEIWRRFTQLEDQQDCVSEEETFPAGRIPAGILRRLKKLYRTLTGPLARAIIDKRRQFNLDQQNLLNKESVPFYLAMILTLQKIKDRLNVMEESLSKIEIELEEQFREAQRLGEGESPGSRGESHD
jgi:hypothetical protein